MDGPNLHTWIITESIALSELKKIKNLFDDIIRQYSIRKEFITQKQVVYNLYFDDYGKTSILICSEKANILTWKIKLKL